MNSCRAGKSQTEFALNWSMLQKGVPSGNVMVRGVGATVKDFAKTVSDGVGLNWEVNVKIDQSCIRPTEVDA
jgi:GDP-D-mannose dehydratase